jgi:transposase InsO family protein
MKHTTLAVTLPWSHEVGGRLNNRAENSHQPFRRRERAMLRFRSLKTLQKFSSVHAQVQVIHRRGPWRSFEAVEFATLEWVDWFNNRRLLEPIGNIPPAEAEERYYAMTEQPAMAA